MSTEAVLEELEVLLEDIEIDAEPDDPVDGAEELKATLCVHYTDEYPNVLPDLSLKSVDGDIHDKELEAILDELRAVEEESRTRGTPVTVESFKAWKTAFDKEIALKRASLDEEKTRGLTPKEREEFKRVGSRLTGRQLFERGDKNLEDDTLLEEGTVSVDIRQYERAGIEDDQEDEGVAFSDSD
ncbi:hypothetical protein DXG01_014583 [Tephrocybe rancida]|nr:hypothetical protein DXG01_014583 [Tephrocybe rancida]